MPGRRSCAGTLVAMPSALPDGEPVPVDGSLPAAALRDVGARGFGVYVHVPFCATRCGYCDFNTYTAAELGGGASREGYADTVLAELELAAPGARRRRRRGSTPSSSAAARRPCCPPDDLGPDPGRRSTGPGGWPPTPR